MVTRTEDSCKDTSVNRERAGLNSASQGLSLYREESLNCRDWSSIARSEGGIRTASMAVATLEAGAISCKQRPMFLLAKQYEEALADVGSSGLMTWRVT